MLKKIWNIITTIVIVIVVILALILFVPKIFGITPMAVLSGSMEPTYHVGGLVFVQKVDAEDIKINDPITFTLSGGDTVVTHRVIEINEAEKSFVTQGDANDSPDGSAVAFSNLKGRALDFSIPLLGFVAVYLASSTGIIILGGIIVAVILISYIIDLFGKDEKKKKK